METIIKENLVKFREAIMTYFVKNNTVSPGADHVLPKMQQIYYIHIVVHLHNDVYIINLLHFW